MNNLNLSSLIQSMDQQNVTCEFNNGFRESLVMRSYPDCQGSDRCTLVFVDPSCPTVDQKIQSILQDTDSGTIEIEVLDFGNAINLITKRLQVLGSRCSHVHILSAESESGIRVGTDHLQIGNLDQFETDFIEWQKQLSSSTTISIHQDGLMDSWRGRQLVRQIQKQFDLPVIPQSSITKAESYASEIDAREEFFADFEGSFDELEEHRSTSGLGIVRVNTQEVFPGESIDLETGATIFVEADGAFTYCLNDRYFDIQPGECHVDSFNFTLVEGMNDSYATATLFVEGLATTTNNASKSDTSIEEQSQLFHPITVNSTPCESGESLELDSGAELTVNQDGVFTFKPNHQHVDSTQLPQMESVSIQGHNQHCQCSITLTLTFEKAPMQIHDEEFNIWFSESETSPTTQMKHTFSPKPKAKEFAAKAPAARKTSEQPSPKFFRQPKVAQTKKSSR